MTSSKTPKKPKTIGEKLLEGTSPDETRQAGGFLLASQRLSTRSTNKQGYPNQWDEGKNPGAHVLAYEAAYEPIPRDEKGHRTRVVMHLDDCKTNVSPLNLYAGTVEENEWDAVAKGRKQCGADKLYKNIVRQHEAGEPSEEIARQENRPLHAVEMVLRTHVAISEPLAEADAGWRDSMWRALLLQEQRGWCLQQELASEIWLRQHNPKCMEEWCQGGMIDPNPPQDNAQVDDENSPAE
ncbi:HNH endonuclease family protein [Acetobacter oeni]|nr:HNH endonuclease [Acetobacter oeni]MBB3884426.1 hypothetical protein [Acetobacter oeni]